MSTVYYITALKIGNKTSKIIDFDSFTFEKSLPQVMSRRARKVARFSKKGIVLGVYPSVIHAKKETKVSNVSLACKGAQKTAGRSLWRFVYT